MSQTFYLLNTNNNTSLCETGPFDFDLGASPGSSVASMNNNTSSFMQVGVWEIEPTIGTIITGTHELSISVSAISANAEFRFRVQQLDAGSCSVLNNSSYSSTYTSAGIKTESLALTWTGSTGLLRISFELRKTSGSIKLLEINTDSDSYVIAPGMTVYSETGSGGAVAGGSASYFKVSTLVGSGGAVAGGVGNNTEYMVEAGVGGVVIAGEANVWMPTIYNETGSGGAVGGGSATYSLIMSETGSGGSVGGGVGIEQCVLSITSTGGGLVGGAVLKEDPVYNYYPNGQFVIPTGVSFYKSNYKYTSTGGVNVEGGSEDSSRFIFVSTGLSADAAPDFAGITIGFQGDLNPTQVEITYDIDLGFSWNTNGFIDKDLSFNWNTGRIRQYWYRVVGKANQQKCEPLANCCQKMIVNLHARSIDDLCQKLTDRKWVWPIESVQKFSRPALNADVAEDEANGIDHTCNTLEEIEVCDNLLCAEFCIDYDLVDYWGASVTRQINSFLEYEADGEIVLGGTSEATLFRVGFDLSVVADGEITVGGSADVISSGYIYTASGGVEIAGQSSLVATNWEFEGGEWPLTSLFTFGTEADQFNEDTSDQEWSLTERLFESDNLFCSVDVSWGNNSNFLVVKGFPIDVPEGSNILGIRVDIERKASSQVRDSGVYLVVGDEIVSDNLAKNTAWPIGLDAISIYGGLFNTWRDTSDPDYLGEWDLEDINNPEFGVAIRVEPITIASGVIAEIDFIKLLVIYEESTIDGLLRTGGEAAVISSSYHYTGSGAVLVGQGTLAGVRVSRRIAPSELGKGTLGPEYAGIRIGGQYGLNYFVTGEGEIIVGGEGVIGSSCYHFTSDGGVEIGGTSTTGSSCYHFTSDGGVEIDGTSRLKMRYQYLPDGVGINVAGESAYTKNYATEAIDGIEIGGTSIASASAYHVIGSGSISVEGNAEYDFGDYGTRVSNIGLYAQALNVTIIFGEDSDLEEIENPEDTVNACGCQDLPLSMQFAHNMFRNNQLSQFLSRNGFTVSRINNLHYNNINSSWQCNFRWKGYSTVSGQQEIWTVVFELTCTDLVGGESIGQNIWKLGINFLQKNLSTGYDFDTKIVVGFLPDNVCAGPDFRFKITMDALGGFSIVSPASSVYQSILYDNIGLFKTTFWQDNPDIEINVSQVGINEPVPRYKINI